MNAYKLEVRKLSLGHEYLKAILVVSPEGEYRVLVKELVRGGDYVDGLYRVRWDTPTVSLTGYNPVGRLLHAPGYEKGSEMFHRLGAVESLVEMWRHPDCPRDVYREWFDYYAYVLTLTTDSGPRRVWIASRTKLTGTPIQAFVTSDVRALARAATNDDSLIPHVADALEEAGYSDREVLDELRITWRTPRRAKNLVFALTETASGRYERLSRRCPHE